MVVDAARLVAWPDAFQKYFEDHFTLRNRLIDWRSSLLWRGLGTTSSDTVIAGKQDWLFYAADGGIDDWTQAEPFTHDELEVWRETLVRRRALSRAPREIPFLFVIAPDKQMIYPEFMPDSLRRLRDDFRADQIIAYMRQTTPDFQILDLRPAVIAAKSTELLYHRYDTHWNDRGGADRLPADCAGAAPVVSRDSAAAAQRLRHRCGGAVRRQDDDARVDGFGQSGDAGAGVASRRRVPRRRTRASGSVRRERAGRDRAQTALPKAVYRDSFAGR